MTDEIKLPDVNKKYEQIKNKFVVEIVKCSKDGSMVKLRRNISVLGRPQEWTIAVESFWRHYKEIE